MGSSSRRPMIRRETTSTTAWSTRSSSRSLGALLSIEHRVIIRNQLPSVIAMDDVVQLGRSFNIPI